MVKNAVHTVAYLATCGSCLINSSIVSVFSNTPQVRAAPNTPNSSAAHMTTMLLLSNDFFYFNSNKHYGVSKSKNRTKQNKIAFQL